MTNRTRKAFHFLVFALFLLATFRPLAGCGGAAERDVPTVSPKREPSLKGDQPTPPPSFSRDEFRPNYGGDLKRWDYYQEPVITYRIVTDGATTIYRQPIGAVPPTGTQADSIRDAFRKIERELAKNEPADAGNYVSAGRRTFVEVGETENALIDVVVQTPDQFQDTEELSARGATNTWQRDRDAGILGRSVMRLRSDLPERVFRSSSMHEALHAVGLAGHSRRLGVILQPQQSPILPELQYTTYDSNTVRANYTR